MDGLYLYCIRKKTDSVSLSIKGIDGRGDVFVLPFQQIEAVVSEVSLEEFASDEIQKKAQNDTHWIREKSIIHENVVEKAMEQNDEIVNVIPMKFGTIFKNIEGLELSLNSHWEKFKTTLEKLEGKQEWCVKLYLVDRKKIEYEVKSKSKIIIEKEKEIATLPEGIAYFLEEKLASLVSRDVDAKLNKMRKTLFNGFKKYAEQSLEGKILEKELTGRSELMILNASYLIRNEKVDDFKNEADKVFKKIKPKGFLLEYSGPWPPYNFV
jgi:hypothetical protein